MGWLRTAVGARIWVLVLMVAASAIAAVAISANFLPPMFVAETTLAVAGAPAGEGADAARPGDAAGRSPEAPLAAPSLKTLVIQARSRTVLDRAARELSRRAGGRYDAATLDRIIRVRSVRSSRLIRIRAVHGDPRVAAAAADAVARELADHVERSRADNVGRALVFLRNQADELARQEAEARAQLQSLAADPRSPEILRQDLSIRTETLAAYRKQAALLGTELQGALAARDALRARLRTLPNGGAARDRLTAELAAKEAAIAEKRATMAADLAMARAMDSEVRALGAELVRKQGEYVLRRDQVERLSQAGSGLQEKIAAVQASLALHLGEAHLEVIAPAGLPPARDWLPAVGSAGVGAVIGVLFGLAVLLLLNLLNARSRSFRPAGFFRLEAGSAGESGQVPPDLPVLAHVPEFDTARKR